MTAAFQCDGHGCGVKSSDAHAYAEHLRGHFESRRLGWTCPCGTFGEGRADVPLHNKPNGGLCYLSPVRRTFREEAARARGAEGQEEEVPQNRRSA